MASDKQIVANRLNALTSTGPRSLAGKERSGQNAIKHGLTAHRIIPGEDAQEHLNFRAHMMNAYKPKFRNEVELVERIAGLLWRMKRFEAFESALLRWGAFQQAMVHDQIESDPVYLRNEPPDELAGTDADLVDPFRLGRLIEALLKSDSFGKLNRYETSLQRQLESTTKLLHEAQAARRERESSPGYKPAFDDDARGEWVEYEGRLIKKARQP